MMLDLTPETWSQTMMIAGLRKGHTPYNPSRMYQGETAIERAEFGYPVKNVYRPDDVPVEE
jgi:hypothetical protein